MGVDFSCLGVKDYFIIDVQGLVVDIGFVGIGQINISWCYFIGLVGLFYGYLVVKLGYFFFVEVGWD